MEEPREQQRRDSTYDAENWRARAACAGVDTDLFFPEGVSGLAQTQIAAAKVVCGMCAVQSQCLEFAIATNQEAGIWGGMEEDARRRLRRRWVASQRRQ